MALDLLYALRALRRAKLYAIGVVSIVALAAAINLAVFAVVAPALVAPLPFAKAPDRLVAIREAHAGAPAHVAPRDYALLQALRTIPQVAAYASGPEISFTLLGHGLAERVPGAIVSGDFFSVLRARPMMGRVLLPSDDLDEARSVVVLAHSLWVSRFGADRSIVGAQVLLNGREYSVVGVMPASFDFPAGAQVWLAKLKHAYRALNRTDIVVPSYGVIGRLARGTELRTARAELATRRPAGTSGSGVYRFTAIGLREATYGPVRRPLELAWLVAGCFLLLACGNLASLSAARSYQRRGEVALRAALGAGSAVARRPAVLEALLLCCLGTALGAFLGVWATRLLGALAPPGIPAPSVGGSDWLGLGLLVGVAAVISLAPVLSPGRGWLAGLAPLLRDKRRGGSSLIVGQIAITTVLLAFAIGAAGTFVRALRFRTGMSLPPHSLLLADVSLPANLYPSETAQSDIFSRLRRGALALPGVRDAAWASQSPVRDGSFALPVSVRQGGAVSVRLVNCFVVSSSFPEVAGLRPLRGRDFSGSPARGVLVSRQTASELWPGQPALGQWMSFGPPDSAASQWLQVIGVVPTVATREPPGARLPQIYARFGDVPGPSSSRTLLVRTSRPEQTGRELLALAARIAPDVPLERLETMESVLQAQQAPTRFSMLSLGFVGLVGLTLAGFGVYALAAHLFRQRESELALRLALGATPGQILTLVHVTTLRWALWGGLFGLLSLWLFGSTLGRSIGIDAAASPFVLVNVGAFALVCVAVLAASYPVGRRACALAPGQVLHAE